MIRNFYLSLEEIKKEECVGRRDTRMSSRVMEL